MATDEERNDGPLGPEDEEIAATFAGDPETVLSTIPHYYRGEISQANTAQNRIDETTNWAITVIAALLTVVFSSPEMPAYLLLIGVAALCTFLSYEVRRYRFFDLYRARVRFIQENVFANALEPVGVEHPRWREELSDDLRMPTFKVTAREALSRRLNRIYGLLFALLGVGWLAKITLFTPEAQWSEAAELPGVPGPVVAGGLTVFYLAIIVLARWPVKRQAKGEVHGEEPGDWKE